MEAKRIVFTFDEMITTLRLSMTTFPDNRTGKNIRYEIMDAASGAFSVFFTQCPSFLSHQKLMQQRFGLSNARTLFGMRHIPSDNHTRSLLDEVNPTLLSSVFTHCLKALKRSGDLDTYCVTLGKNKDDLLIALDGTTYFSSSTINCDNCSTKVKEGKTQYYHSMVTPTIVKPGNNKVISLAPEFIRPQDGDTKQDCELKASKRWINQYWQKLNTAGVTVLADDLYAHEPFCRDLLKQGCNFIFVCKPESHKTVYEWVKGITKEYVEDRFNGQTHQLYTYNYAEGIPLRDGRDAVLVNFVEVRVTDRKSGKQLYHNAFVTNHPLNDQTLPIIIDCGRARWKIENENNNTLKTQGYHLEHNFGHGRKYLAAILATMNILAFLFHTLLDFMNKQYQLLKKVLGARKRLFEHIRVLLIHIPCTNFDHLLTFMIESLKKSYNLETLKFPV